METTSFRYLQRVKIVDVGTISVNYIILFIYVYSLCESQTEPSK